jgi:hypothetical protein
MNSNYDQLPEKIKRRIELSKMFYPLERKVERRWGNLFKSEFEVIVRRFKELSIEKRYSQKEISDTLILWEDVKDSTVECMFYFINEPSDLNSVQNLYKMIAKYKSVFTYAIVHQKKDGENCYDIFRCTPFSYLEHCNRVRYPLKK